VSVHGSNSILVLGPTASGKTALAIALAQRVDGGGECISADSMQVYRGMDIGTAKATPREWSGVPHHLIDIVEPNDDSFSADRWMELCAATVREIQRRGRTPIIVGGTNLYVQALLGGMSQNLPPPDDALRARLNGMSRDDLRAHLEKVDPQAAQRIHINDRKRTIRAIEVFEQTGTRLSEMQGQWEKVQRPPTPVGGGTGVPPTGVGGLCRETDDMFIVGLDYPVEAINRRINARVKAMIEHGLVEEVMRLHQTNALGRNAREALGYKQIIDHLEGRSTLDEAIEQIKIRTRRYAKQQRTWLRRFRAHQPSIWLDAADQSTQSLAQQALTAINGWLNEPAIVRFGDVSTGIDPDQCAS
jgi:tRNA dimethylallyltransferase